MVTSDGWAIGLEMQMKARGGDQEPLTLGKSRDWMASKPLDSGLLLLSRADSD
jgi:hypothetical protein